MNIFEKYLPLRAPDGPAAGGTDTSTPSSAPAPAGGGGGGSPAPSSPEPASVAPEPAGDTGFQFPDFDSDLDNPDPVIPAAPATPEAAPATPAPAPAPAPEVAATPSPAPATPTPQPENVPAPSAGDPLALAQSIEQHRDAAIEHLAKTRFALSEAELAELETDVTAAVPKLLSRVFLEAQVNSMKFLAQAIPQMFQQQTRVSKANGDAEKKFFESHKELDINNPQHKQLVAQYAIAFRQVNPQATLDEVIKQVGVMAKTALGVAAAPAATTPTAPALPPGAPAAMPFRPAVGSGAPPATPVPVDNNPWSGMAGNFDDE